jgi:hypothetical protein
MKSRRDQRLLFGILAVLLLGTWGILRAQKIPGLDSARKEIEKASLAKLLQGEPPVTTSLADALTEVPFLDDYEPGIVAPLTVLPRGKDNNFLLDRAGVYGLAVQSYCLHAGTHAPSGGDGYLYAPLKGSKAAIIRNILQRSVGHPELEQKDIQRLIWAVIARAKISDMSAANQAAALALLTPQEIYAVNGGALGLMPEDLTDQALAKFAPSVRRTLRAEAKLRDMLTHGQAAYADLEKAAVLPGDPPPAEGGRRVPRGRWSYHPNGYFVRYFPHSYSRMEIQISRPGRVDVARDASGRITSITDSRGNRVDAVYDDAVAPLSLPGQPPLAAHAFRSVRFEGDDPRRPGAKVKADWAGQGWTFVGLPKAGTIPGSVPDRFAGLSGRLDRAVALRSDMERLVRAVASARVPLAAGDPGMGLAHFAEAVGEIVKAERPRGGAGSIEAVNFIKQAWQAALMGLAGGGGGTAEPPAHSGSALRDIDAIGTGELAAGRPPMLSFKGGPSTPEADGMLSLPALLGNRPAGSGEDPSSGDSGDTSTPGNPGRQRLAPSARPSDKTPCSGKISQMAGDVKINGQSPQSWTVTDLNGAVITTGGGKSRIRINLPSGSFLSLGRNSSLNMTDLCAEGAGAPPPTGTMSGGAAHVTSAAGEFQVKMANDAMGIRGELHLLERLGDRTFLASLSPPPQSALIETELLGIWLELRPGQEVIDQARSAFFVAYQAGEYFFVGVDKGPITVTDAGGTSKVLNSGERLFLELKKKDGTVDLKVTAGAAR